jgi:hypothetical protein
VVKSGADAALSLYSATTDPNPTTQVACGGTLSVTGAKLVTLGTEICPIGTLAATAGAVKSCAPCPAGKYCDTAAGTGDASTTATACDAGDFQPLLGATAAVACTNCVVGTYSASGAAVSCTACAIGTYQDVAGQTSCKSCPGATAVMQTTCDNDCADKEFRNPATGDCEVCPLGYGVDGTSGVPTCELCPAGQQSPADSAVCTDCAAGYYAPEAGTGTCSACPAGTSGGLAAVSCTECPAGEESTAHSSSCTACVAGYYRAETGDAANALCVKCPSGLFTNAATGATTCTVCPIGERPAGGA